MSKVHYFFAFNSCAYSIVSFPMLIASRILFKLKQQTQTSNFLHATMPRFLKNVARGGGERAGRGSAAR